MAKPQSIKDLIASKQKDIQSKKGRGKTWKPTKGKNRIRILPSWRGEDDLQFWHDFGAHFIKNASQEIQAVYICADKTFNKECEVCQAIGHGIRNASDDETTSLLKEANASQRYLMNVLVLSDPDETKRGEPRVMETGIGVFEDILEIISEYDDITRLEGGVDLVITREGSTVKDTKYTVMPSPKSIKVPASVMEKITNLDEYVAQENESERMKAVAAVGRAAGILTAGDTSAEYGGPALEDKSKGTSMSDDMGSVLTEDDIDEISDGELIDDMDDMPFTPDSDEKSVGDSADDISDEDLDALLSSM